MNNILGKEKLYIADVGATGGPEARWSKLLPYCYFYTFDPDPRAKPWSIPSTNYPIGLWSKRCQKSLHLKRYPPASSFFETSSKLQGFINAACMESVGREEIQLDTLDHLLKDLPLDFLKIDAEGAELEILKGGEEKLTNCLGMQLEVSFYERHEKAPFFSDIDLYLRERGFQVYQIHREHWIRKNNFFHPDSSPQLIWGNALYLRTEIDLKDEVTFTKFFLILLAYRLYDYAYELCEQEKREDLKSFLLNYTRSSFPGLVLAFLWGLGRWVLTFSGKKKQRRMNYLKRKLRLIEHYVGRAGFGIYDEA